MTRLRTSTKRADQRQRCIANYDTKAKFRAVQRWSSRIAAAPTLTKKDIAKRLGKKPPRITEYTSFLIEPPTETFDAIEKILYDAGV